MNKNYMTVGLVWELHQLGWGGGLLFVACFLLLLPPVTVALKGGGGGGGFGGGEGQEGGRSERWGRRKDKKYYLLPVRFLPSWHLVVLMFVFVFGLLFSLPSSSST